MHICVCVCGGYEGVVKPSPPDLLSKISENTLNYCEVFQSSEMKQWSKVKQDVGIRVSNLAGKPLKVNRVHEDCLQQAENRKMLKVCGLQSKEIGE